MRRRSFARWIVLVFSLPTIAYAVEPDSSALQMTMERVIVFKDGYSLVIKRAAATTDASGEVYTDDVPDAAVLGSFWAVPEEGKMLAMRAGWKSITETEEKSALCTQPIEILQANKGKSATIELYDKAVYSGIIQEVLIDKFDAPLNPVQPKSLGWPPPSVLSGLVTSGIALPSSESNNGDRTISQINGGNFILRTNDGDMLLPVSQIRSVLAKGMETTIAKTLTTRTKIKRLSFKLEGAHKKHRLSIMYFRPGIRWIPTYRVTLPGKESENRKATISLQAELLNEAENLTDVPIDIVVGVPNFRFKSTPSPLVLEATMRNVLTEVAPAIMGNQGQLSNALFSQRSGEAQLNQAYSQETESTAVSLPGELSATGAEDLFIYSLPKTSLDKGERIAVSIFSTDAPYRDVYTWDLRLTKQNFGAVSGAESESPLVLSKNEVWHQIELTNTSNVPWTTGAAMLMLGNQPLSQELLTYTPPKGDVRVPITVAVDMRGTFTEKEIGRALKSLQWEGYSYARVDNELKLKLCNHKTSEINAEVTLHLGGKVDKVSDDGEVVLNGFSAADWEQYQGSPAVNNSSLVRWKGTIKPGSTLTPDLQYHFFTRH